MDNFSKVVAYLDSAERSNELSAEEILRPLCIGQGDRILDVGAGTGYLTIPATRMTDKAVFALDNNKRMLELLNRRASRLPNIKTILSGIESIPLPDSSVDIAIASLVLHEAESVPSVLSELYRVLSPGGRILVLEYEAGGDDGPPQHIRIPSRQMESMLTETGFRLTSNVYFQNRQYRFIAVRD